MAAEFRSAKTTEQRRELSVHLLRNFPDRVPVVFDREAGTTTIPQLAKSRYLVPCRARVCQLAMLLRGWLNLHPTRAIYILVPSRYGWRQPAMHDTVGDVYRRSCDKDDGFLYAKYTGEVAFG